MAAYDSKRALELLRLGCGRPEARFREGQEEAIRHVVEGRGRLLVVQKTGWGKSFVYFIATRMLRDAGAGPALLISPLLSLMRNQIQAAERMGARAVTIHSDNQSEWPAVEEAIGRDAVDILLISPERLANDPFRAKVLAEIGQRLSLLVIDEAHCISDWGHDFRPHYRLIERIARTLPQNLRLLATTATANDRVLADLEEVLGQGLEVSRGDLSRPSLALQTISLPSQAERLAWLAKEVPALPGHGIIYTLTIRDANRVADWLRSRGLAVESYTSETGEGRPELEQALLGNRVKALVATTALGMGFDKPDLSFVIHYQMPGSVVAYYQQVGRAGRAMDAYGVLLSGEEEQDITDYFIESAFPKPAEVEQVLAALENSPQGLSVPDLLSLVNLSKGRVEKVIALLSLEAPPPLVKQGSKWQLTAVSLSATFWERAERLTALRHEEQRQMAEYVALTCGHMEFLVLALDGDPGSVTDPPLSPLPASAEPSLVREAEVFLRRTHLTIEPRRMWPTGGLPRMKLTGKIAAALQAEEGRALCTWGDAGWGRLVREGKYRAGRFSDELIEACVELVHDWSPEPSPEWVTSIASRRHPHLVPDLAQRIAAALDLPFAETLNRIDDRPEQKTMANSAQQARNVDGSLAVLEVEIPGGPVLLVDDMIDSRWTMTVAAWLLRKHGSGLVRPLALAFTGFKT
ncbi:MAG TPA: DEAD/DEAH box helicase [Thermoanaerobaculia bacterium]|jgi:ATP-dependent DNA helicase RecQ|nr:DEAD/DEAH box helicase [Thermoanaerobaculia bacterium]